jgi:hypothetical protein
VYRQGLVADFGPADPGSMTMTNTFPAGFGDAASAMRDELTRLRHALHREPEIGLHLPRTRRGSSPRWPDCR